MCVWTCCCACFTFTMLRFSSCVSSHLGHSAFFLLQACLHHLLVVMETRVAAATALAWVLYVSPREHGMLNRVSSAGQTTAYVSLSQRLCKKERIASQIYREVKTQKVFCKLCAYKSAAALPSTCISQPFVSKM